MFRRVGNKSGLEGVDVRVEDVEGIQYDLQDDLKGLKDPGCQGAGVFRNTKARWSEEQEEGETAAELPPVQIPSRFRRLPTDESAGTLPRETREAAEALFVARHDLES